MLAYDPNAPALVGQADPSEELRIAVTFRRPGDQPGPTHFGARLSTASVEAFRPDPIAADLAIAELSRHGLALTARGELTASMRCSREDYERLFGTQLSPMQLATPAQAQFGSLLFPAAGAPWNPDPAVAAMIDDAYIQWPHIYMGRPARSRGKSSMAEKVGLAGKTQPVAPRVQRHTLSVPGDVARLLNATAAHQSGVTGAGVRVVMIDSGFDHKHPYFAANDYRSSVVLAPRATDRTTDRNGHGTGESANVFAVAPGVTFIGVKLDNDADPRMGASMLEGLQEALKHDPHVISVSLGHDLRAGGRPAGSLPNSLAALEAEIQAIIARGIVVVFSAGNGHYGFPGQMPEVISAGGVHVDAAGSMEASNYASAFPSAIYSGRTVPDLCGLVGMLPHADYIGLPISPASDIDRDGAAHDGTTKNDGWGYFSGTSAAAPQIAGVCALILQAQPGLTPSEVKAVLRSTARDVTRGNANPSSDPAGVGIAADGGEDGATGAGLVDAFAAVKRVRA